MCVVFYKAYGYIFWNIFQMHTHTYVMCVWNVHDVCSTYMYYRRSIKILIKQHHRKILYCISNANQICIYIRGLKSLHSENSGRAGKHRSSVDSWIELIVSAALMPFFFIHINIRIGFLNDRFATIEIRFKWLLRTNKKVEKILKLVW